MILSPSRHYAINAEHIKALAMFLLFIASAILFWKYDWQNNQDTKIRRVLVNQGELAASQINRHLNEFSNNIQKFVEEMESSPKTDAQIRADIEKLVKNTRGALRGGIAFNKEQFSKDKPLYSPYYQKAGPNDNAQQLSDGYDYTQADSLAGPRTFWFHQPLAQGKMWLEPYFGTNANTWLAEYIAPFKSSYDGDLNDGYDGIAFLNISLKTLSKEILKLKLGVQGFGFLVARDGRLLAYPDASVLGTNVFDMKSDKNDLLFSIAGQLQRGQLTTLIHPVTGREQWMVFQYIPALNADLGLIIDAEELRKDAPISPWYMDAIVFLALAGVIFLMAAWRFPNTQNKAFGRIAMAISFCFLSFLILLWNQTPLSLDQKDIVLIDSESAELARQRNINEKTIGATPDIATKAIHFTTNSIDIFDGGEVRIAGSVSLQGQYSNTTPLTLENAVSQQWYLQRSTEEAQVWRYDAILKQPFDYKAFPFDRNIIELKLIPTASASTNESDLLLPLFDAYPSMKSESLPGVFENLNGFGGWQIQETYFSYQKEDFLFHTPRLVLKYNLVVQRILTGPLISHVMPLFVVSFLTYSMLLLWAKDEKKRSLWGFNTANVLQYCASLFFILTVAHVALRDTLNAQGFVFIEYFYFITYLQILFTAMASLLYTAGINIPLIDKERGIRIKQLYWPCLLLFCVMVTLLFFQ